MPFLTGVGQRSLRSGLKWGPGLWVACFPREFMDWNDCLTRSGPTHDHAVSSRTHVYNRPPSRDRPRGSSEKILARLAQRIHNRDRVLDVIWTAPRDEILAKCLFASLLREYVYAQ
jgi:hypothetical protein